MTLTSAAPFLCHPNLWIRYGAVGFITTIAQHLNVADVYCKLMPHLHPFISQPIIQVSAQQHHHHHHLHPFVLSTPPQIDKELVLLSVLKEPVSRSIFDYALRSRDISSLFRHLLLRQKKRMGSIPECPAPDDPAIMQMLKKLLSQVSSNPSRTVVPQPQGQGQGLNGRRLQYLCWPEGAATPRG